MPSSSPWPTKGESLILDPSDVRLAAIADFLTLHTSADDQPLVVPDLTLGEDRVSLSGWVNAWGSTEAKLEFAWFPDTEAVKRIVLSKPIEVFDEITLPFLQITNLRQYCAAEVATADGNGIAHHTGKMSGTLKAGDRLMAFELSGYGLPSFDLPIDFWAPDNKASQPPGLRDLAGFLGLMEDPHADLQCLPAELQSADLVSLIDLSARIEPADAHRLTRVEVTLGFLGGRSWPLISGFHHLEVGDLKATLAVEHPLESDHRFPRLTVRGTLSRSIRCRMTTETLTST